jgi:hypothetical protein
MKNRGCVADAILKRFGVSIGYLRVLCRFGCRSGGFWMPKWSQKGTKNNQNGTKWVPKINLKSMKKQGCVLDAFLGGPCASKG